MPTTWRIGLIEGQIASSEGFQKVVEHQGLELLRGIDFTDEHILSNGFRVIQGKAAQDHLTEIERVEWRDSKLSTTNNFVLSIDSNHSLGLIENSQLQLNTTIDYEKTSDISTFALVPSEFVIVSGKRESGRVFPLLEESLNIDIQPAVISVDCVVDRIDLDMISGKWEDVDEYTQLATVSGELASSLLKENKAGRQVWAMFSTDYDDTDTKLGISEDSLVIYSPYNYSAEDVVQLVSDEILPCISR